MDKEERLARALGWFSVGLGLVQLAVPQSLGELIGVGRGHRTRVVMRGVGMRELAAGVGILSRRRPAGWIWSRVGGDGMDLALLGNAIASGKVSRPRIAAATVAVAGITALDLGCSLQLTRRSANGKTASGQEDASMEVKKAITINRPVEEVYTFWRNFENLPRFMTHLESVQVRDGNRSHWVVKAPAGQTVEWDAQIVEDTPNEMIAWRSLEGADVPNWGTVRFKPAPANLGSGTEVHINLQYDPPGGKAGSLVAMMFGEEPDRQVTDDLHIFKQILELGERVLSDGVVQKGGPAQPLAR
jgi:uncharacterized membrane protein